MLPADTALGKGPEVGRNRDHWGRRKQRAGWNGCMGTWWGLVLGNAERNWLVCFCLGFGALPSSAQGPLSGLVLREPYMMLDIRTRSCCM